MSTVTTPRTARGVTRSVRYVRDTTNNKKRGDARAFLLSLRPMCGLGASRSQQIDEIEDMKLRTSKPLCIARMLPDKRKTTEMRNIDHCRPPRTSTSGRHERHSTVENKKNSTRKLSLETLGTGLARTGTTIKRKKSGQPRAEDARRDLILAGETLLCRS